MWLSDLEAAETLGAFRAAYSLTYKFKDPHLRGLMLFVDVVIATSEGFQDFASLEVAVWP